MSQNPAGHQHTSCFLLTEAVWLAASHSRHYALPAMMGCITLELEAEMHSPLNCFLSEATRKAINILTSPPALSPVGLLKIENQNENSALEIPRCGVSPACSCLYRTALQKPAGLQLRESWEHAGPCQGYAPWSWSALHSISAIEGV